MGSGYAKKKKEAKLMREKFEQMQAKLKEEKAEGSAGNGLVTVVLNGEHEMLSLKIKPECVDPEDVEGLEDLIRAAYSNASKKLEESSQSGLSLPPGLGF